MTDLRLVASALQVPLDELRPDVQVLVRAYDLDDEWLRRLSGDRCPSSLSVADIRRALGADESQAVS